MKTCNVPLNAPATTIRSNLPLKRNSTPRRRRFFLLSSAALVLAVVTLGSNAALAASNPYLLRTFEENGKLIDEILVPGSPPPPILEAVACVPEPNVQAGINNLSSVPAFTWCYGCSATSAAMMMGFYDLHNYPNMYAGPSNGGACPLNNVTWWGQTSYPSVTCGECPLAATHIGKDGRVERGHVEDYWIDLNDIGPDPWTLNGWAEHTPDCTADFMGTSAAKYSNPDGSTMFYSYNNGSPLYDYTGGEPGVRDGCHGLRLFVESRGYTVSANFSQYIYGYNGNTLGFTYTQFKSEIDAGRPVLIQLQGHTVLGYGYNDTGSLVYVHDTWDNSDHSMTWGGSYSGLQHYGVAVLRLNAPPPTAPTITQHPASISVPVGSQATFTVAATSPYPISYYWRRNGSFIAGATNTAYSIKYAQMADSGAQFSCLVSNAYGTTLSSAALLTVITAPTDWFTEWCATAVTNLAFQSFNFTPDASVNSYQVCVRPALGFPTDPAGGINLNLPDDGCSMITLSGGNTVALYSTRTNKLFVGSNGYLTMKSGDTAFAPSYTNHFCLPRVSALYRDLNPSEGGSISWKQLSDRVAVTYQAVPIYGATSRQNNFQVELFFNGRIRITCLGLNAPSGLVGLSAGTGQSAGFVASEFATYGPCFSAPVLVSAGQSNGVFSFAWSAIVGETYQVQCKANVSQANWSNRGGAFPATNSLLRVTDPVSSSRQFYRVVLLPAW